MPRVPNPERRAAILRAARTLFAENSYAQTTMAEIAAAAGMGVGSLYVYFPTKEAIAMTLVDGYFVALHGAILPPLREQRGVAAIARAIAGGLDCANSNQDVLSLCRLVAQPHTNPANMQLTEAIEQAIAQQMRDGYLRQYDPAMITRWVNGQVEWVITQCFLERHGTIGDYQQLLVGVIGRALAPQSERGRDADENQEDNGQ
jgi:AcrR family transcriptional regulator